jgi:hypothetical protein
VVKPLVVAVDPGKSNGVALVRRDDLAKLWSDEVPWLGLARYLSGTFKEHGNDLDVVCEAFRISPATATNSAGAAHSAIEVIGQIKLLMAQYGVLGELSAADGLPLQTVADAEAFLDGKRLRALGWWHRGGKGHANMALRHAGLRLLRTGVRDRRLLGLE